jgi:hypothetical protein
MAEYDQPEIGLTGARFGGTRRKRKAATAAVAVAEAPQPEAEDTERPAVGTTGARFGGSRSRAHSEESEPPPADLTAPQPIVAPFGEAAVHWPLSRPSAPGPEPAPDGTVAVLVRPYVFTGGRTRARIELALETLVSAGPRPPQDNEAVVGLCRRPISVAEIAALMGVPLGVARVVVGDLAAQGALVVHESAIEDVPDLAFLERVLMGLRRL